MKRALNGVCMLLLSAICAAATTNEIQMQVYVRGKKDASEVERKPGILNVQWTGSRYHQEVYACTTNWTAFGKGSVGDLGWCYARNLSSTTAIAISFDGGVTSHLTLKPGEPILLRLTAVYDVTQMQGQAAGGTNDLEVTILED